MFMVIVIIFAILALTLFDLPFLFKKKNPLATFTYYFLILIGIFIAYINIQDLPVASPAIYIEKLIDLIIRR
ncbi:hypothetical protein SAMN05446037_1010108 [Anaerovirgula multivorans]|uniref:Uncharacterized protein n=1 Tax=Anaerovirgula multivorans TaxID=312168 RepID=A0A239EP55_9FIRM|nr:hypothetical protein [Anaerovirgula multivorans]SNS45644.1 hypothetical protein SAMN05446037_1010108 [Anaerovirgula multivorans]